MINFLIKHERLISTVASIILLIGICVIYWSDYFLVGNIILVTSSITLLYMSLFKIMFKRHIRNSRNGLD